MDSHIKFRVWATIFIALWVFDGMKDWNNVQYLPTYLPMYVSLKEKPKIPPT